MGYTKVGYNPVSLQNLSKGSNLPKLTSIDAKSRELANTILNELVEHNGEMITKREAILRAQVEKAKEGDLRSCQFLIELAGNKQEPTTAEETPKLSPLEELYSKMIPHKVDDRRRKILSEAKDSI